MERDKIDFGQRISFDTKLAVLVGINAAIVHEKIAYFVTENRKAGRHEKEGQFWFYTTYHELSDKIDILTPKQVRTAVDTLVKSGYLKVGYFSYGNLNRTTWYTVPDDIMEMIYPKKSSAPTGKRSAPQGNCSAPQGKTNTNNSNSHSNAVAIEEKDNKEKDRPFSKEDWDQILEEMPRGYHPKGKDIDKLRILKEIHGFKPLLYMLSEVRTCCGFDNMEEYLDKVRNRFNNPPVFSFWHPNNRRT